MDTTQPVTAQLREKVYNDLWEATLHAMDKEELSEEDAQEVADFILGKLDTVQTHPELFSFLEELASKWPVYSNVFLLLKSEEMNQDKIHTIQQQLQQV